MPAAAVCRARRGGGRQSDAHRRDWRFELLRFVAMYLILASHYFGFDNWQIRTDPALRGSWGNAFNALGLWAGQVGVVLFILISAYFLAYSVSNPLPRLVRLWVQVFVYSAGTYVLFLLAAALLHHPMEIRPRDVLTAVFPITSQAYWFVSAYFVLMLLVPFINRLLDNLTCRQSLVLTGIVVWVVFIWQILDGRSRYWTEPLYMIAVYLIGALIRRYPDILPRIRWWDVALVFVATAALTVVFTHGLRNPNPFSGPMGWSIELFTREEPQSTQILEVLAGSALFICVAQGRRPERDNRATRAIIALAPATFGIYLLHNCPMLEERMWNFVFSHTPEPHGIMAHLAVALGEITVLYVVLLMISLVILKMVVTPLVKVADRRVARPLTARLEHSGGIAVAGSHPGPQNGTRPVDTVTDSQ